MYTRGCFLLFAWILALKGLKTADLRRRRKMHKYTLVCAWVVVKIEMRRFVSVYLYELDMQSVDDVVSGNKSAR